MWINLPRDHLAANSVPLRRQIKKVVRRVGLDPSSGFHFRRDRESPIVAEILTAYYRFNEGRTRARVLTIEACDKILKIREKCPSDQFQWINLIGTGSDYLEFQELYRRNESFIGVFYDVLWSAHEEIFILLSHFSWYFMECGCANTHRIFYLIFRETFRKYHSKRRDTTRLHRMQCTCTLHNARRKY